MHPNKLALACGIALATLAGQAAAQAKCGETGYDPYTCAADAGYDMIYLTGASGPDNFLETTITAWLDTGYTKITDGTSNYRAFVGRTRNAAPVPAAHRNKSIRFIKRSAGGSIWGVNAVARDEFVQVLDVKNTSGTCSTSGATRTCPLTGVDGVSGLKPTFGVSDVSPKMFKGPLNVEWDKVAGKTVTQLSPAETGVLTIKAANTLMMGIVATNVVPATTNFSRAVYGDLLRSGGYADWTQVDPSLTAPGGPLEAKPQVVVCRRVPGSGTQTSYNWFFGGFPCTQGSQVGAQYTEPKRMPDSAGYDVDGNGVPGDQSGAGVQDGASAATAYVIDVTAGQTILENLGSGDVRNCLDKAQNGGVYTFQDETGKYFKVDFGTGGYGAVGVLSLDSLDNKPKSPAAPDSCNATTGQSVCGWSFRNLDGAGTYVDSNPASGLAIVQAGPGTGIAPSKANLVDGKYDFAAELTFQYKTAKLAATPVTKSFVDEVINAIGQPAGNTSAWVAALPPAPQSANTAKASRGSNQCGPLQYFY